jgi:hypothetical protein
MRCKAFRLSGIYLLSAAAQNGQNIRSLAQVPESFAPAARS